MSHNLIAVETAKSRALGRKRVPGPVSTTARNGHKVAALVVSAGVGERLGQGPAVLELLNPREKMGKRELC